MLRRTILVFAATTLASLAVPALPAIAGGGCHDGVTTGEGDTVEMVDACFTPTTLRVDPGDTVTFVNTDPMTHNVTANQWGHFDDLNEGDSFRVTFDESGTYPYACTYHPGMSGAIIVGDGTGAGNGEAVTVAVEEPPAPPADVETRTIETAPSSDGSGTVGWLGGGALGLAAGLTIGVLVRRQRSTQVEPARRTA
jgi:plastocyanin